MSSISKETQSKFALQDFSQIKSFVKQSIRLTPATDKKQKRQFRNRSQINSQKTTLRKENQIEKSGFYEDNQSLLKFANQCPHCLSWNKWAMQQQKDMLELENKFIERQIQLHNKIAQLIEQLESKNQQLLQMSQKFRFISQKLKGSEQKCLNFQQKLETSESKYREILQKYIEQKQKSDQFLKDINLIQEKNLKLEEEIAQMKLERVQIDQVPAIFQTPAKTEIKERQERQNENINIQIDNILQSRRQNPYCEKKDQIKASTECTKALKNKQNVHKNNEQVSKKLFSMQKPNQSLDQLRLQNKILKQYNNTLVEHLKKSKARKL